MSNAGSLVAFDPVACAPTHPPMRQVVGVDPPDETIELRRACTGDDIAFTALYRRHHATVYRFAWLVTGSAAHAADVTQDVFVDLLQAAHRYDAARGSLRAYLCGMARLRAYKSVDRRVHSVADMDALPEVHDANDAPALPLDCLERSRALRSLYAAIRTLPPLFRDVLILVELQEMSYADAAAIAGIELGTVRSRLSRARAKLAQILNEGEKENE